MTVKEFLKYDFCGTMYQLIDYTVKPCITNPHIITEVDRNVAGNDEYGNMKVVGFRVIKKGWLALYVKP